MGTVLVSTRGFKNELCHSRSVLVSAHCFKNESCFLCSVLVLTHPLTTTYVSIFQGDNVSAFAERLCSRRNRFGSCYFFDNNQTGGLLKISALHVQLESRHLLNFSVQNALDCISENSNLKNFSCGASARNSL